MDEILVVGASQKWWRNTWSILKDFEDSVMIVKHKKSQLIPFKEVYHLGFIINFKDVTLEVPKE